MYSKMAMNIIHNKKWIDSDCCCETSFDRTVVLPSFKLDSESSECLSIAFDAMGREINKVISNHPDYEFALPEFFITPETCGYKMGARKIC